jgi:hypothetical protein
MAQATKQHSKRIVARKANVVAVDFGPEPPDPDFPGAGALREDHPKSINLDDDFARAALWPRGRRIAS